MAQGVDPEAVIAELSQQIGALAAQMAMRSVALQARDAQIAELTERLARYEETPEPQDPAAREPEPDAAVPAAPGSDVVLVQAEAS